MVNVVRNREAAKATAEAVHKHAAQVRTVHATVGEPATSDPMCEEIMAAASSVDIMVSR